MAPLIVLLHFAGCSLGDAVDAPRDPAALNVLFIGNSLTYTNDIPGMVLALIDSADAGPAEVASVAFPNFGLEDHVAQGDASAAIAQGGWDFVVMQQGPSATEGRPSLLEFTPRFATEIRAAGAEPALYMVWPSRGRFGDFPGVSESYRMAAEAVDGVLIPVGDAWTIAWDLDADLPLYGPDGFHPSAVGSYLAALVMYERFTGRSPQGLPAGLRTESGVRVNLDAADAAILQQAAGEANAAN